MRIGPGFTFAALLCALPLLAAANPDFDRFVDDLTAEWMSADPLRHARDIENYLVRLELVAPQIVPGHHFQILRNGNVPLDVLESIVGAWVKTKD